MADLVVRSPFRSSCKANAGISKRFNQRVCRVQTAVEETDRRWIAVLIDATKEIVDPLLCLRSAEIDEKFTRFFGAPQLRDRIHDLDGSGQLLRRSSCQIHTSFGQREKRRRQLDSDSGEIVLELLDRLRVVSNPDLPARYHVRGRKLGIGGCAAIAEGCQANRGDGCDQCLVSRPAARRVGRGVLLKLVLEYRELTFRYIHSCEQLLAYFTSCHQLDVLPTILE